jgi:hypothetical protein
MRKQSLLLVMVAAVGCEQYDFIGVGVDLDSPTHLRYQLEPSGTPGRPAGVILRWDDTSDPDVFGWNVYGRDASAGPWQLLGTTTSPSWHDQGQPELQYHVTAYGSGTSESGPSNAVTIDERLALAKPGSLSSISLNGAVALVWSDESYQSDPDGFWHYRVYAAPYDLDRDLCGSDWGLEGTTVAAEFRVGALANGVPRCFAVSGISIEGFESLWSPIRADTPRPEARNVALTARQVTEASAGFRFWRDANGDGTVQPAELGRVSAGSGSDIDFAVNRDGSGRLLLTPVRAGASVAIYGTTAIGDLTAIDVAPTTGYGRTAVEARPGWGYVFELDMGDGFYRYGALRVSHVGRDLIIFDWSFQTDPGNPELVIASIR